MFGVTFSTEHIRLAPSIFVNLRISPGKYGAWPPDNGDDACCALRVGRAGAGAAVTYGFDEYEFDDEPRGRGALPWLFAGAAIVVAVFGIAGAVMLTGNNAPAGPSSPHHTQAAAPAASPTITAPAPSATPTKSAPPAHKHTPSPSPTPPPSSESQPPSPAPQPTHKPPKPPPPGTAKLTAAVNGWSQSSSSSGTVAFQVQDTGSAATGQVTVTITLPAGASMTGVGGGGGEARLDQSSWSCQATSTGATCTHAGLAAGNQTWGAITFAMSSGSACDQPVDLTAVAGSLSSSAQSTVSC